MNRRIINLFLCKVTGEGAPAGDGGVDDAGKGGGAVPAIEELDLDSLPPDQMNKLIEKIHMTDAGKGMAKEAQKHRTNAIAKDKVIREKDEAIARLLKRAGVSTLEELNDDDEGASPLPPGKRPSTAAEIQKSKELDSLKTKIDAIEKERDQAKREKVESEMKSTLRGYLQTLQINPDEADEAFDHALNKIVRSAEGGGLEKDEEGNYFIRFRDPKTGKVSQDVLSPDSVKLALPKSMLLSRAGGGSGGSSPSEIRSGNRVGFDDKPIMSQAAFEKMTAEERIAYQRKLAGIATRE